MPDQLLIVLQRLGELQSQLKAFPFELLVLALSTASVVTMLIMAPWDYRFERMRLKGVPRAALAIILSGLVALGLLSLGLDGIKSIHGDLPWGLDFALLATCATSFIAVIYFHVRNRDSFTVSRFTNAVVIPLAAPVLPLFGLLQSAWSLAL